MQPDEVEPIAREYRVHRIVGLIGRHVDENSLGALGTARQDRDLLTGADDEPADTDVDGAADRPRGCAAVVHDDPRRRDAGRNRECELIAGAHIDRVAVLLHPLRHGGQPHCLCRASDPGPRKCFAVQQVPANDIGLIRPRGAGQIGDVVVCLTLRDDRQLGGMAVFAGPPRRVEPRAGFGPHVIGRCRKLSPDWLLARPRLCCGDESITTRVQTVKSGRSRPVDGIDRNLDAALTPLRGRESR